MPLTISSRPAAIDAATRELLALEAGDLPTAAGIASAAERSAGKASSHFARLLGELGIGLLLERSLALARTEYSWLGTPEAVAKAPSIWTPVWRSFEEQTDHAAASEAFIALFGNLVGLLRRLIGDGLVFRSLSEVWPTIFDGTGPRSML